MDHPRPGLRYVDAGDLDDSDIDFDGMDVESEAGEKLGDVDGFIIDVSSARPYYVVVDAGGWFTSKHFLLPVGHAALDTGRHKLIADLPRERVKRYPGFDRDEFSRLSETELNRMDEQMAAACCPGETVDRSSAARLYETGRHYHSPNWWKASYYRPDRFDTAARSVGATGPVAAGSGVSAAADRDRARQERIVARTGDTDAGDVSPHFGGRAQPGDVIGLETGGERTHVGETSEDENKRRREAEKAAEKKR